ncbi:XRE family transcriptional regulator [Streptosporangium lutulentum]|uniref:Zn-dependent peptidase ImmA (M78 family)/DNA-binding XRE family transcriptional regulator n=1 Tax=Streptosporangium lutulentum TaxID=1461250 RepID=A0ABT9QMW6_9ACTN|nr:XRE family transcriptional regulator [Streptosporangium lutulentum]MDP9848096.1 Zn-dependent peptidase ImmA (M78 family)/DNA-binding XRE family transcriptional regulator [Streptosporangium lutulentum]
MSTQAFDRIRLRTARELAQWSQAKLAGEAGLTPAAISQFESGAARPSPDTIAILSRLLAVPLGFFHMPMTESHEGFFRSLRRTSIADRRRARAIAHVAHDLAIEAAQAGLFPPTNVPTIPVSGLDAGIDEIEQAAARIRSLWDVPPGPLTNVVGLLEAHGVTVIRLPLGNTDVDAFSLPFADHSVVVLSTDKNDRARSRFDCAHELGHLILHGEQIWGVKEVETQAHQFAAALLMPAIDIYDHLPSTVDWPKLFALKQQWQVSLAALLMRAKTLGKMKDTTYLTAIKTASARGWRRVEPVPLGPPEQPARLLEFLSSPRSVTALTALPAQIVENIRFASTA